MPKGSTKLAFGGKKKITGAPDTYRFSTKANKKLPPLVSNVTETTNAESIQDTQLIEEQILANTLNDGNEKADGEGSNPDNSISINNSKLRATAKRRSGGKQTSYSNASPSISSKRVSAKPKIIDVEQNDAQVKSKPRRKGSIKPKPPDRPQSDQDTEALNKEGNSLKSATDLFPKPQWTNIVKRVQMHKHQTQKNRIKTFKKKDLFKRKRSEFVIENTWLPREPAQAGGPKENKKAKTSNKAARESRKMKELDTTSNIVQSSEIQIQFEEESKVEHVVSANVTFEGATTQDNLDQKPQQHSGDDSRDTEANGEKESSSARSASNHPVRTHQAISSPKLASSPKPSHSPKLHNRETTHVKQINVADFAKLHVAKPVETNPQNLNITDYQYRASKVRFKGASNSVPNYNDKQENVKMAVAQNDALLSTAKPSRTRQTPIYVSKIEPKSQPFLQPITTPHRNKFMDMLIGDAKTEHAENSRSSPDPFPRINYGSPTPLQKQSNSSDDDMSGEISIIVPKLPHLNRDRRAVTSSFSGNTEEVDKSGAEFGESTQHTEDEPVVIVINENGKHVGALLEPAQERDGWESGYNSMTPRLSVDSRSHALTPMSALLEIPSDHRSMTPFSTITTSTYLDHSRPQSTFLDVPQFIGSDTQDLQSRKYSNETRLSVNKLPAIYSRNDDGESADGRRMNFTPLPLQSIRTSDGELSD